MFRQCGAHAKMSSNGMVITGPIANDSYPGSNPFATCRLVGIATPATHFGYPNRRKNVSDDFFNDFDKKLVELKTSEQEESDRKAEDRAAAEVAIMAMHPVATEYAAKLRERGITARVSGGKGALVFEMRFADNGDHGLSVYPDLTTGRLVIYRNSTDHTTGRGFRSTDGMTYAAGQWAPERFEAALKSVINEYLRIADKHGGVA